MLFSSAAFLFYFFPLTLLSASLATSRMQRRVILLIANYIFYGAWDPRFLPLLLFISGVDFYCGNQIYRNVGSTKRKLWLGVSIGNNLTLLFFFKYFNFFAATLHLKFPAIVLPLGISFLTFQSLSYTIDLYRRETLPAPSFLDFALFVSLFPQLIAGPIVRYRQISQEFEKLDLSIKNLEAGLAPIVVGLAKKILIADQLAPVVAKFFDAPSIANSGLGDLVVASLAYTFQIYFDFSGYSDMAVGLAKSLGLTFPRNFKSPYHTDSMQAFWRSWHITLSEWFRDYVYIPLGGSRGSRPRMMVNLMLTMLLAGLWHGANWTFLLWGGYHGALLVVEKAGSQRSWSIKKPLRRVLCFSLVVIGWVIFRAPDLRFLGNCLTLVSHGPFSLKLISFSTMPLAGAALLVAFGIAFLGKEIFGKLSLKLILLFILTVIAILGSVDHPFLYYQF